MGGFKDIFEPVCIVALFTAGALINSRSRRPILCQDKDAFATPKGWQSPIKRAQSPSSMVIPRLDGHILSRFLDRFPFLMEILYWNLTYWLYQLARAFSAYCIRGNDAVMATATRHALQIRDLEIHLGIAVEKPLQDAVLAHCPRLMDVLATVYYSHITVGVAFLVYCYTYLPFRRFAAIRRTLFLDNWIAFAVLTAWRTTPPRLLPYDPYGYVDVLHSGPGGSGTGSVWTNNRFQLTIAAMPSLHFGTSLFLAVSLWRFSPHAWLRAIAFLWPAAMLFTILATANHWILDAVAGVFVVAAGWRFNHLVGRLVPIEECFFRITKTERPRPGESVEVLKREMAKFEDAETLV
ncbi:hypothetical protein VTK73DRAFT_1745 [Phialemonium thermophilum]|uniref:Inositolphosphotransferase Aur1/Ipt1 domain-containing protein n=1 Tax=Phialemonium thermophilum TaxID=223376 RepID=A0ABR3X7T2_9PEZI